MASTGQPRAKARQAHSAGPTYLAYTPDGDRLITVGSNNTTRVYKTGSDGEPTNIDDCPEGNMGVAATDDFFIFGSEEGTVSKYSLATMEFDSFITRFSLPVRDVAISADGKWCAMASDELVVKIVNIAATNIVHSLREQSKPTKHLAFDPSGTHIALSSTDGIIYLYAFSEEGAELVRKVDGVIRPLETDSEISSKVVWHPDGRAFAAPTAKHTIQVVSVNDGENQREFSSGIVGDVMALAWSPNGAILASACKGRAVLLHETKTQDLIKTYDYDNIMDIAWHPTKNIVSFTDTEGHVFIHNDFVPSEYAQLRRLGRQPAPFIHDPLAEISNNVRRPTVNGTKEVAVRPARRGSLDSLDALLDSDLMGEEDDFVVDDDGAGYSLNANGKRPNNHLTLDGPASKRMNWQPTYHESFQPGATPWRGNRKYLCLNLIGFVWTVDQDTHHTVTVEFYDREFHRDFHFTDTFRYDKACLNEHGTLFSSSADPESDTPANIFYRPHETWTERQDWRTILPKGENITSISLSDSFITVTTSANYVRVFTLFLTPYRVYRQKSSPSVTCASWRDYILTMGNGAVGADGVTRLVYTIENVKRDEVCQNEDVVALAEGTTVKNVFFSDSGDPCIYDSTGTLLILLHWRTPSQARWIPLLDTKLLSRLASGRKTETYWPVAVADGKFHCIILKGGDLYPYFPRPLLSEFAFQIPLSSKTGKSGGEIDGMALDEDTDERDEREKLEGAFVQNSLDAALLSDLLDSTSASHSQKTELARREIEIDKTLLQLLAVECREGEEKGMKALELVKLMRDRTGRMVEAAVKVAERYNRGVLVDKVRELGESLLLGEDEDF